MELPDELFLYEIFPGMTDQELSGFCSTNIRLAGLCEQFYREKVRQKFPFATFKPPNLTWRQHYLQILDHINRFPYYIQYGPGNQVRLIDSRLIYPLNPRASTRGREMTAMLREELSKILWWMNSIIPIQILPDEDPTLNNYEFYYQLRYLSKKQMAELIEEELIRIGHVYPS